MQDRDNKDSERLEDIVQDGQASLVSEFLHFLSTSKKWWLTPILLAILLLGLLIVLGSSGAAPFIYTLF